MGMNRAEKEGQVTEIKERLDVSGIVVLTHNNGLDAASMSDLRVKMRASGVTFKVAKNKLAKLAVAGTRYEKITDMLTGPTGMATSEDVVSAAKVAHEFAKKNDKLVIIGGAMGDMILDADAVKQLASLPSLDELRSKIVGLLVAAPTKLAGILQAPARDLVGVTKAYSEKA